MRSRYPFTESQWEELEQQAQIFKYIASGLPVPPHLLFPIRKDSCFSIPTPSSKLFSRPSPHFSWNVYEMGMGRKIDPEPGRCRRTDGKKWRCSKEAYPDSKYCERHMHRGKNRSRKPVEFPSSSSSSSSSKSSTRPVLTPSLSLNNDGSYLSSSLCSNTSGPKQLHGLALYSHLDCSGPFQSYMDDESDPYRRSSLFQMEPSGSVRGFSGSSMEEEGSWGFTPLTINPSSSPYIPKQDKAAGSRFSIMGTEVKQEQPFTCLNLHQEEEEKEKESKKKAVHMFFDEWPQEHREMPSNSSSVSTTLFI